MESAILSLMTFLLLRVEAALFSSGVNYTLMRVHDCGLYEMWLNSNVAFLAQQWLLDSLQGLHDAAFLIHFFCFSLFQTPTHQPPVPLQCVRRGFYTTQRAGPALSHPPRSAYRKQSHIQPFVLALSHSHQISYIHALGLGLLID